MSIIRVGLSDKNFASGYEAIFGKKKSSKPRAAAAKSRTSKSRKKQKKS